MVARATELKAPARGEDANKYLGKFRPLVDKYEGPHASESLWKWEVEPHGLRRAAIVAKHPEIAKLPKYDPLVAIPVVVSVLLQLAVAGALRYASTPTFIVCVFVVGGTINHSLGVAIHETGHNLVFGQHRPMLNRALGMVANLPLAVPFSATYLRYHGDHHRYLGHEVLDVDIPTWIEIKYVRGPLAKAVWLFFHFAIVTRPFFKAPKGLNMEELVNLVVQFTFNAIVFKFMGFRSLLYLMLSTFCGFGPNLLNFHLFSEHYMHSKSFGTMSYYGPLNYLLYNIGYHNEHHDFPNVACTSLAEIRKIAPEFYDTIPSHSSGLSVLWDFIFDPNMGPHAHCIGYLKSDLKAAPTPKSEVSTSANSPAPKKDR